MKITDQFVGDHKTFRKMLFELGQMAAMPAAETPRLVRLVELFKDTLLMHTWAEDHFYYPAVRAAVEKIPASLAAGYLDRLEQARRAVGGHLERLETQVRHHPPVHGWPDTYALFFQGLRAHMEKEEAELFPLSEKLLGAQELEKLACVLKDNRAKAPRARRPAPIS